jgi:hypothetical protein
VAIAASCFGRRAASNYFKFVLVHRYPWHGLTGTSGVTRPLRSAISKRIC